MSSNVASREWFQDTTFLTHHAIQRMQERNISKSDVDLVISYGRKVHVRGATIFAVGRKEAERYRGLGVDLVDLEGIQIVCNALGEVMTVYRNRDFRGLRPRRRGMH